MFWGTVAPGGACALAVVSKYVQAKERSAELSRSRAGGSNDGELPPQ